ncbi:GntR family transcriptional regulator [Streptomyces luteireticuli]|uniref:GntR family transcriptional regulator n=2 Tax=Streptomyces luteireticuli TaxID=173858 RepID=A0ABP3IJK7_9ACTN
MMLFRVDPNSPLPLADQVAACVRGAISDGTVHPGERLPAAGRLAESLGINVHTVLRGYQQLRDEGLIELRRGRGAVVTQSATPGRTRLLAHARDLVVEARGLGMSDEDVLALVRASLTEDR